MEYNPVIEKKTKMIVFVNGRREERTENLPYKMRLSDSVPENFKTLVLEELVWGTYPKTGLYIKISNVTVSTGTIRSIR